MSKQLLTNKYLLIGLGIIALLGLLIISYNAANNATAPAPSEQTYLPKSATLPPPKKDHPVSGQLIVKFKKQYTNEQINADMQQYHARILKTIEGINQTVILVPNGQESIILKKLQKDPLVETAQQDYTTHAFFTPNDPEFSFQYAFNNNGQSIEGNSGNPHADIHAETAWDVTKGNGIKVAILDTGINLNHPDLAGKVLLQKSFVSNSVEDGNGHGTHVAGIVAADTNNSTGVAGTCPECQLLIGKVLDDNGNGTTSNAAAGITWAADNGAKVINMSLGTTDPSTASLYAQAVNYAMNKGAVVVAAAGNDGSTQLNWPAATHGVISVAATTNKDQKPSFSNFGSFVQIAAPGDNILSTSPTHPFHLQPVGYSVSVPYMFLSGTSMATPYVSGVAALVASTSFGSTPQAIINRLYATADKINGTGTFWVHGRVNAAAAVGTAPTLTSTPQVTGITPTLFCVGGNGTPPCATIPPSGPSSAPSIIGTNPSGTTGSPSPSGVNISGVPSPNGVVSPSPVVSGSPSGNQVVQPPCGGSMLAIVQAIHNLANGNYHFKGNAKIHIKDNESSNDNDKNHNKKGKNHHKSPNNNGQHRGWLSHFIAQIFKLLELLLQFILHLISHCQVPPGSGVTAPSPSVSPGVSMSPVPSISISPIPTISMAVSPTLFGTSPTPGGTSHTSPTPVTSSNCTTPKYTIQQDPNNPQNGITIGKFYVDTDTWNAANYQLTQTVYVCDYNNWYAVANMNDTGDGAVKTYPDVHEDFNNVPLSSFTTITSSYSHIAPNVGNWDFAYDIWVNGVASAGSTEVMIWTQALGKQASAIQSYPSLGTVTLGGVTYNVHHNGNSYIALQMLPYANSGTVDIKAIFNYLISKGIFPASSTLGAIDYGVEIVSTNGTNQTFKVTNFSLTTN